MDIKTALQNISTWFEDYVKEFSSDEPGYQENIDLKTNHTYRVRDAILDIGNSMNLGENDMCMAEACALLHDVGRFEQYKKYGTFSDSKSENHAALGVRIIRKHNALKDFPPDAQKIIIRSVGCHNMSFIPQNNSKDWILFLKLLRDADKIDILYVVTDYYKNFPSGSNKALEMHLPDTESITDAVYTSLSKGQIALVKDLHSLNDFKLYQMGWVYDLNFTRSLEIIKEKGYLEMLRDSLPASSEKVKKIYRVTSAFLNSNK